MFKSFLLVGISGSGKSTTGNCIFNKSGANDLINKTPFETSDAALGCTLKFQHVRNSKVTILDTVGFGDPEVAKQDILGELKKGMQLLDNKVDCVLFILRKSRFTNEIVQFFELVQETIFKNKCLNNSILIITDCQKGWVAKQTDEVLKKAVANCNDLYYEFYLKFDDEYDTNEELAGNFLKRQIAVDNLCEFLSAKTFERVDLSHIQTSAFQKEWYEHIIPILLKILFHPHTNLIHDAAKFVCKTM